MSAGPHGAEERPTTDAHRPLPGEGVPVGGEPLPGEGAPWQRLHSRMIWVDALQTVLSLAPIGLAVGVFGAELGDGGLWPVVAIAVAGVFGAVGDALRWLVTRYRVTDTYVERRSGVVVRSYRSVRRDRIRSVDIDAKLRHRLAGLRVVTIGAGQQSAAGESAFALDAVLIDDAERLRHLLLRGRSAQPSTAGATERTADDTIGHAPGGAVDGQVDEHVDERMDERMDEEVFARLRPRWVVYNMLNVWAYVMALGLLWGGYWLGQLVNLDLAGVVGGILDWEALGWVWTVVIGVLAVGAVGVIGLTVNFFTEHWGFELARVPGEDRTLLRTRQGLFRTREVNRDDTRMRGVQIAEPVLWRWMGMADTTVITTGLDVWSMAQPTAILPRGPINVAQPVAAAVLGADPNPLVAPLTTHPGRALRRRLWWATLVAAGVVALLGWLAVTGVVPARAVWVGGAVWPLALGAAVVAYRALGHAIVGEYLVVRSGLFSRATTALQRPAVSTIAVRESLLQRRLKLKTVSAMTAAGYGIYEAPDLDADDAIRFAADAAPGLLDPFLVIDGDPDVDDDGARASVTGAIA